MKIMMRITIITPPITPMVLNAHPETSNAPVIIPIHTVAMKSINEMPTNRTAKKQAIMAKIHNTVFSTRLLTQTKQPIAARVEITFIHHAECSATVYKTAVTTPRIIEVMSFVFFIAKPSIVVLLFCPKHKGFTYLLYHTMKIFSILGINKALSNRKCFMFIYHIQINLLEVFPRLFF